MHTRLITPAAPGTTRATLPIAAISWVTVSWVATASSNTMESTQRLRRPRRIPVSAITSATASNTRSGRFETAILRRQYTSVDGSNDIWVSDRPHATFHRISNFNASAVCASDRSCNSLRTSTEPTRSAGSDGRPVEDPNRSAMNESGNSRWRCSAKNANTLPSPTNSPTITCASSSSRSHRVCPCTTRSSHATKDLAVRHDDHRRVIQWRPSSTRKTPSHKPCIKFWHGTWFSPVRRAVGLGGSRHRPTGRGIRGRSN